MPVIFHLTLEGYWDRLFKSLGLAEEFQTRHAEFDRTIYIACDHFLFMGILKEEDEARQVILELFKTGFQSIYSDGETLWMSSTTHHFFNEEAYRRLMELKSAMAPLQKAPPMLDLFARKAVVMETITLALLGYAAVALAELFLGHGDSHLDVDPIVVHGLILAAVLFLLLCVAIVFLFRGSSRGHRIIIENAFLLLIALPTAGIQSVSDLNRGFDDSPSIHVETVILDKDYRRKRRRTRYYVHPENRFVQEGVSLPERIRVSEDDFSRARVGGRMRLEIGAGWLGHPWYRKINFEQ
ncbi:MAG: hypothetical protein K8S54_12435 [Spirochaetia bacterium]|nr:hypothetical protein [Spirochaetia bacterium]